MMLLDLLRERAAEGVRDVDLAALQHDHPGRRVGDAPHDEGLDARRLAPVLLVGLEHELHARLEGNEPVGTRPDRMLLEAVLADLLEVLLRDDPAGAGQKRAVERHEVRPRSLQTEADVIRIGDLDRRNTLLHELRRQSAIAREGEFHVLGGDGIAVVKAHALAEDELVDEPVG